MARSFNGSSDYLQNANSIVSSYPLSISCQCNLDNITSQHYMVSIGDTGSNGEYIALIAKGDVGGDPIRFAIVSGGSNLQADSSSGFSSGNWHHAGGVVASSTDIRAFLDGGNKGTSSAPTVTFPTGLDTFGIGRLIRLNPAAYTAGDLGEVGVWDVALTDGEMAILGLGVSPLKVRPQNLIEYWPLLRNLSPEIGLVGGFDLTVSGATKATHSKVIYPSAQILQFPSAAAVTAGLTGTMTATVDEDDITTGGKTIIITLTGDTFKAAGTGPIGSTADTQALIDGFDAATSPTNGWNNEVRDKALTSEVVRTSSTIATWTVSAQSGYDVSAQEIITGTIPTAVLVTGAGAITATPTFTVDFVSGFQAAWTRNSNQLIGMNQ